MSGLQDIVTAMADTLRDSLEADYELGVQVEPRYVLNPTPPVVDIYPGEPARDLESAAFDDLSGGYFLTVRTRIGTADYAAGYDFLIQTMDDEDELCLGAILLDDPTLGGHTTSLDIRDPSGLRAYEHPSGEGALLGWQFTVLAIPARS